MHQLHIHLDDDGCIEAAAFKESSGDGQDFADRIIAEPDVWYGRVAMIPTSTKLRPPAQLTIVTKICALASVLIFR
jgi:hypothetical protein